MQLEPDPSDIRAYARLAINLCETISAFLAATASHADVPLPDRAPEPANDNEPAPYPISKLPDDPMTLKEVRFELRISERQIALLRRLWAFPSPWHHAGKLLFSRRQVERWARAQSLAG